MADRVSHAADWTPHHHRAYYPDLAELGPGVAHFVLVALQVNNAGIARGNTILNTSPEEFLLTYKVNVLGCHNILREFLPHSACSSLSMGENPS